ncbi:MAG TPA: hypothetical protein VFN19_02550 [Candidatus Nanopelagicales bacterium]|nr:hypothetical protein [Candidatus Nanopelagicales bacterium]
MIVRGQDRGSLTAFFAVAVAGLLLLAGLVVDGGAKVRAGQRADRLAAEAGRAAGQQVDLTAAVAGNRTRVDPRAAVAAARTFLAGAGVAGDVAVGPDGRHLTVTVTTSVRTVFLGLIGVDTLTAHGTARVRLVAGIDEEQR